MFRIFRATAHLNALGPTPYPRTVLLHVTAWQGFGSPNQTILRAENPQIMNFPIYKVLEITFAVLQTL